MITFSNKYYSATFDANGMRLSNAQGDLICLGTTYHAEYGYGSDSKTGGSIPSGTYIEPLYDIDKFQVGDKITVYNTMANDTGKEVTITSIEDGKLYIEPTLSNIGHPNEYAATRFFKKITDVVDVYTYVVSESEIVGGKKVVLFCSSNIADVSILFYLYNLSPRINIEINTEYKTNTKVFEEYLDFGFNVPVSEVYRKNRKIDKDNFQNAYWLDKQGVKFGNGNKTALIYNAPNVSSLYLKVPQRILRVNLDNFRDHRYRRVNEGLTPRTYVSRNASEFYEGQSRLNSFSMFVGADIKTVPRIMHIPKGYIAGWTASEHADYGTLAKHRAVWFGREDITNINDAVGGFAKHNIIVTKSIFYWDRDTYSSSGYDAVIKKLDGTINEDYLNYLDQLHNAGYEIILHTPGDTTTSRAEREEAIGYIANRYGCKTWIDHRTPENRDAIGGEGLVLGDYYVADLWRQYGIKYFWAYGCEDWGIGGEGIATDGMDLLQTQHGDENVTPLYFRHPTITNEYEDNDFVFFTSWIEAGEGRYTTFTADNVNSLVRDWGFSNIHNYFSGANSSYFLESIDGKLQVKSEIENILVTMEKHQNDHRLLTATVREFMDYWLAIENVDVAYADNNKVIVKNNGNVDIEGFSLAVRSNYVYTSDTPYQVRQEGEDIIIWFNLRAKSQVTLELEPEKESLEVVTKTSETKINVNGRWETVTNTWIGKDGQWIEIEPWIVIPKA